MFIKHFLLLFFITNLFAAVPVYAASAGQKLSVEVYNLKHGGGQVGVNLFMNDDEMFANPYRVAHASIKEGKAVVVFENLPFGNYAAVAYHDENTNQKLDHHFLFAIISLYCIYCPYGLVTFDVKMFKLRTKAIVLLK